MSDRGFSVIIPAYNEERSVQAGTLHDVSEFLRTRDVPAEAIVVDDGSTDGTAALVSDFVRAHPNFRLVRTHHGGKAHALMQGVAAAVHPIVIFCDMDQSIPISEATKILPWFERGFDIVVGSRGLVRRHAPWSRQLISRAQLLIRRLVLGFDDIVDTQCGFKALRRDVVGALVDDLVVYRHVREARASGISLSSGFDVELLFAAKLRGLSIKEVPIDCVHRPGNQTKLVRECGRGFMDLMAIRAAARRGQYRLADARPIRTPMTSPAVDGARRVARLRLVGIAVAYAITCAVMLAPISNVKHFASASYGGDSRGQIWTLAWDNHALLDRRPLFDANIYYPERASLAFGEHMFAVSLASLPVYAVTRNPVLSFNVAWLLGWLLTAACAHALAWRYTRDHLAAFVAGAAFGFCFFRMHHTFHLNILWAFGIPLSLIALEDWIRRATWGRLAWYAVVVVLQVLVSWYQAVMLAVADVLFVVWIVIVQRATIAGRAEPAADVRALWRDPMSRVRISKLCSQAAIGLAAAFALIWPFARHYVTLPSGGLTEAVHGGADLVGFLVPPENTYAGQWLLAHGVKGPRAIWGELTTYLGWTTLLLAVAGAVVSTRRVAELAHRARFFIVLAVVALLLALGPSPSAAAARSFDWTPFGLLSNVPGVRAFRVPARYTELLMLGLAMLAATACAALHRRFRWRGRLVTVALLPLLLAEYFIVKFPGGPPQPFPVPAVYKFVATLPREAIVSLPDYINTPLWFEEDDYMYFSTSHWHPIVNGDLRQPHGFPALIDRLKAFPDPPCAETMRQTRIRYVVLHARSLPHGAGDVVVRARASADFRLLARFDTDYVFEVVAPPLRIADPAGRRTNVPAP